jgi:hypothetical protein
MRSARTRDWKYIRNLRPEADHTTHIDLGKTIDGNAYWKSWTENSKIDSQAAAIISRYRRRPAEELYDLQKDPLEQNNVADNPELAGAMEQLRAQLDSWMREQGDSGRETEDALKAP